MKYLSIIKYALLLLSVVFVVYAIASFEPNVAEGGIEAMLYWAYALIFLTIGLAVLMPLVGIAQNPKSAKKSLVGVLFLAVIFVVSWVLASDDPITLAGGTIVDNVMELKFADMGLWATYFTFAGVLLAIVGSEIYKLFK